MSYATQETRVLLKKYYSSLEDFQQVTKEMVDHLANNFSNTLARNLYCRLEREGLSFYAELQNISDMLLTMENVKEYYKRVANETKEN